MQVSLVTWNVNSVRLRIDLVAQIVQRLKPDVLCLQETKVEDHLFPRAACEALGFPHIALSGMKAYNGVAVLSKLPLEEIRQPHWCGKEDCRHIIAKLANGLEIHNLYVPAGGDIPNPEQNPKFAHKLSFLNELSRWYRKQRGSAKKMVLVGDLNVAPLDTDVWDHRKMLSVVSHTPVEIEALGKLSSSLNFYDAVRHFVSQEKRLYTWWSYRAADWAASDRGRRLDHIWVTPDLKGSLRQMEILKDARSWTKPSDHVPVKVILKV